MWDSVCVAVQTAESVVTESGSLVAGAADGLGDFGKGVENALKLDRGGDVFTLKQLILC